MKKLAIAVFMVLSSGAAFGQQSHFTSPYTGQETRRIKSLSSEDIAELQRGGGWGLAKAAELNVSAWTCPSTRIEGQDSAR